MALCRGAHASEFIDQAVRLTAFGAGGGARRSVKPRPRGKVGSTKPIVHPVAICKTPRPFHKGGDGADRARIEILREWARYQRAAERKYRRRALIVVAAGGGEAELRAIARQSLRHIFVGRAQRGPLRVQRRIMLIGLHQSPVERVSPSRRADEGDAGIAYE